MINCTRKIQFDAAHRIMRHESKCKYLHGHRYIVEATFTASSLDEIGRVVDFGVIKEVLGGWIDDNFDHNTILSTSDKDLGDLIEAQTGQKVYYLDYQPTAENIAKYLFEEICPQIFKGQDVKCIEIIVHETPNCYAKIS